MSNLDLIRGRQVVEYLTNQSGGAVAAGDVVYLDTAHDESFTTGTTSAYTGAVGVAFESIASAAQGRVIVQGYCPLVNVNAAVTRGHFGATHTVVKQATDAGAARVSGTFCQFLTGGTTPSAHLFNVPDFSPGAGLAQSYIGYNSIGASTETATTLQYFKQVVLAKASIILAVEGYILPATGGSFNIQGGVLTDNSGSPYNLMAAGGPSPAVMEHFPGPTAVARWMSAPVGLYVPAGTYWLMYAMYPGTASCGINYDTGGTDVTQAPSQAAMADYLGGGTWSPTVTTRKYSIRASILS